MYHQRAASALIPVWAISGGGGRRGFPLRHRLENPQHPTRSLTPRHRLPVYCRPRAIKKDLILTRDGARSNFGEMTMRARWWIAIHHEDQNEHSLMREDHFVHFADAHQRMKRNKDKIFVVGIPKTAKPMEVQAFHNLRRLGYRVETG